MSGPRNAWVKRIHPDLLRMGGSYTVEQVCSMCGAPSGDAYPSALLGAAVTSGYFATEGAGRERRYRAIERVALVHSRNGQGHEVGFKALDGVGRVSSVWDLAGAA